ncbi:hypothetical protein Tco_0990282 [Tanacetum coccineum]|uniref:Reverse transcriptase domain-containing protein n=1 Tax=Tanacetum coccineum TaxID=301880 RepID=A0ABQ5EW15_9ASTR
MHQVSGTLPSNTITNPRCEARAITTRSGLSYTPVPPIPPPRLMRNESLTEEETEPVSSPISPEPSSAQVNNSPPSKEPSKGAHLPYPQKELKLKKQKEKNDISFIRASINLMPIRDLSKAVSYQSLSPNQDDPPSFANGSVAIPNRIDEDVLVKVGHFSFPADFVVVDYEVNYRVPLILW